MSPWYKIPRAGGATMWFDRERPDLEPAPAPRGPQAEAEKPARARKGKAVDEPAIAASERPAESDAGPD